VRRLLRKRWLCLLLVLLIGTALLVFPASRWRIIGWLRGESFYQARPTSYWSGELSQWGKQWNGYQEDQDPTYARRATVWDDVAERLSGRVSLELAFGGEELQLVNPEAVPVLLELLTDSRVRVRTIAALCLGKIGPEAKSAFPALLELFNRMMAAAEPAAPSSTEEYVQVRDEAACSREVARALLRIDSEQARQCAVAERRTSHWAKRYAD